MVKPGDQVRYLNDVGGGTVTRIEGRMAYVLDNGFENPVLASDLVVIVPAGHKAKSSLSAALMFDQEAFDSGNSRREEKAPATPVAVPAAPEGPVEETEYGDKVSIALAFEPSTTRNLATATFYAVLLNDSNYWLDFSFMGRSADDRAWQLISHGTVAPNEMMDLKEYTHETLREIERIALQAIAYKKDKSYELKPAVNIQRRLDLTKFHKLHCFRPGLYFDTPVIELQLVKDDVEPGATIAAEPDGMKRAARELETKYRVDSGHTGKKERRPQDNPNKLLPLIEVDLHIGELVDSTDGMDNAAMLELQLSTVRKTMQQNSRRIGQKIVFIHGKGEGVLRKAVLALLKKEFPKAETQDASFREYGFGATLVTIH